MAEAKPIDLQVPSANSEESEKANWNTIDKASNTTVSGDTQAIDMHMVKIEDSGQSSDVLGLRTAGGGVEGGPPLDPPHPSLLDGEYKTLYASNREYHVVSSSDPTRGKVGNRTRDIANTPFLVIHYREGSVALRRWIALSLFSLALLFTGRTVVYALSITPNEKDRCFDKVDTMWTVHSVYFFWAGYALILALAVQFIYTCRWTRIGIRKVGRYLWLAIKTRPNHLMWALFRGLFGILSELHPFAILSSGAVLVGLPAADLLSLITPNDLPFKGYFVFYIVETFAGYLIDSAPLCSEVLDRESSLYLLAMQSAYSATHLAFLLNVASISARKLRFGSQHPGTWLLRLDGVISLPSDKRKTP